jgi:hypothetical protein
MVRNCDEDEGKPVELIGRLGSTLGPIGRSEGEEIRQRFLEHVAVTRFNLTGTDNLACGSNRRNMNEHEIGPAVWRALFLQPVTRVSAGSFCDLGHGWFQAEDSAR